MNTVNLSIGIIVIVAILSMIGIIYADTNSCDDKLVVYWKILCYVIDIHIQNNSIIDKLDWNNCAISHKKTYGYSFEDKWFTSSNDRSNNYNELVKNCGEIP